MITCWLTHEGDWKSITANERIPRASGSRRRLNSRQVWCWWQNELTLIAAPCFDVMNLGGGGNGPAVGQAESKTFFTIFSITDRMHRPQ